MRSEHYSVSRSQTARRRMNHWLSLVNLVNVAPRSTDRLVFFGGYIWGLTTPSPDTTLTLGLTFTF